MLVYLLLLPALAAAQFGNLFEQIFHHDRAEQRQQREPQPGEQYRWSMAQAECDRYLCNTFDCVNSPKDCPCPFSEDVRCDLGGPEGGFVCVRGGCDGVQKALKLGSSK
ncbi:hypothetical protein BT69DRAFT_1280361 [Atractiella rhizophila]|nr:hypothetical protein BT69DRAFT_1283714 [Atractiella rhizophila]KAH8924653.1 hypothetical protein BT69DRAFT_1280361 [Atractiella rhizophila]